MVVDATRELPAGYTPVLDEIFSTGHYLDSRVTPYYEAMYKAAKQDGVTLTPFSAYRSVARQQISLDSLVNAYIAEGYSREKAQAMAEKQILPPGTSEHNLGLCVDIIETDTDFDTTRAFRWLQKHAHEYGFILRYPKDKEAVTGIVYEPWHWRFVGTDLAPKIRKCGLTLEEYLQQNGYLF
ncbi:MAG: M15 family metallopeptidase [Clostridia bacterium]|nr:M15 family metallopeptidase [Clostridia bacterium]